MTFFVLACLLSSFAVSVTATAVVRRWAPRWGLIDQPAARKVHKTPTPLGGGIGIWLGVVLPIAAAFGTAWWIVRSGSAPAWLPAEIRPHLEGVLYRSGQMWGLLAGGTLLSVMGLVDDLRNLPWLPRLGLQFCVAIGLVVGNGIQATVFAPQPWIGQVLTVFWILVLINAFNFLDNMDALSSGIALIAAVIFATIMLTATSEPRWLVAGVLLILSGSLLGFLVHNWPPAKIFMGDTGSYFIGLLMASMTVLGTFYEHEQPGVSRHVILAPLCVLAVPLYDFCSVMIIRLSQGRSPFHPDKSHFSHRLVEVGLKSKYAVMTVHLVTLATGLGALLLYQVPDWTGAGLVLGLVACLLAIIAILEVAPLKKRRDEEARAVKEQGA